MKNYYVYIIASKRLVLYIGITNDLQRRIYEHKHGIYEGFTKQYNVDRLIYFECFSKIEEAIAKEKQLKNWNREKKLWLIKMQNPELKEIVFD
ncbi:MAG TPA: GIY-YIG nuclease family protein [Candidatus Kapabacteria bacterium]|nr:GIY-YIG nuclease family protein [Candidatus Kapabacteria bacterium]